MKLKPVAELASFKNADGARITRGFHSQNFPFQIRNYVNGALLYYKHLCQRANDDLCEWGLHEGTSKFGEGKAASVLFGRAKKEGMNITIH